MSNNESVFDVDKKKKKTKKKDKTTNDEEINLEPKENCGDFIMGILEFILEVIFEILS